MQLTLNDSHMGNSTWEILADLDQAEQTSDPASAFIEAVHQYRERILWILLVPGIAGNIVNLLVLTRPSLRGVTFVYLFWLAVSDLCYLLIHLLMHIFNSIDSAVRYHNYHVMLGQCRMFLVGNSIFCASSAFLVAILTIDRHRAVLTPFKGNRTLSRRRAFMSISISFLLALVINVPLAFITYVEQQELQVFHTRDANGTALYVPKDVFFCKVSESLTEHWLFTAYNVLREGISKTATVLIVTILNIRIIIALRKQGTERKSLTCSAHRARSAEERKLVQLLLAIVIVFVVCMTPQMVFWMTFRHELLHEEIWVLLDSLGECFLVFNAAANFYIYCFSSAAVRATVIGLFCSWRRSSHRADLNFPWTTSASVPSESTHQEKIALMVTRSNL